MLHLRIEKPYLNLSTGSPKQFGLLSSGPSMVFGSGGTKKKGDRFARSPLFELALDLDGLHVLRLPAFGSLDHTELNGLTFLQGAEAARLNRRVMDENVLAILTADEAVALRVIEPLYCSLFHGDA